MTIWQRMVRDFHAKFELPVQNKPVLLSRARLSLRMEWIKSELEEMWLAEQCHDLAGVADGIVDAIYFLVGTAVEMGVDLDPLFRAVHEANMRKVKLPGVDKIAKPDGWEHPDIAALIEEQRRR